MVSFDENSTASSALRYNLNGIIVRYCGLGFLAATEDYAMTSFYPPMVLLCSEINLISL